MPILGTLTVGDLVEIEFQADAANAGATVVNSGYDVNAGTPVPVVMPRVMFVAPGGAAVQRTLVGPAVTLIIDIDVPDAGGGRLEVRVNGALRDSKTVSGDIDFIYIISTA